jgi:hypothetical protein
MTRVRRNRPPMPVRQTHWTRLGSVMRYTDTEPKRAEIRAAVATMVWVEPDQLGDVLQSPPVRFVVAGLFHGCTRALHRASVCDLVGDDRYPRGRLIGLESVTGDRYVLLDTGHDAIDILHGTTTVVGAVTDEQNHATEAARHLYEAEVALHEAHQSHVDVWIAAAADRLHDAVVEHLRAVESTNHGSAR